MKNIVKISLSLLTLLTVSACNNSSNSDANAEEKKEDIKVEKKVQTKINVELYKIKAEPVEDTVNLAARIDPWRNVQVSSEVTGKIISLNIGEGQWIKAGDNILEVEHDTVLSQIKQAKANYEQTKANYEQALVNQRLQTKVLEGEVTLREMSLNNANKNLSRDKNLMTESVITQKQFDDKAYDRNITEIEYELSKVNREQQKKNLVTNIKSLEAQMKSIKAQIELLENQLSKTYVKSPISGFIDIKNVEYGELINPGSPITNVLDIATVKVIAGVPERELKFVKLGNKVKIELDAYPGEKFLGTIDYIANKAEQTNKTFPITATVQNIGYKLKPGMLANITLVKDVHPNAILIPRAAVLQKEANNVVYVEENGKAVKKIVDLGNSFGQNVLVKNGLNTNDKLVVVGHQNLTDGKLLNIVKVRDENI